jgi:hypothetical protein
MRERIWRRALAVLAVVIGVGLAVPATPAGADTGTPTTSNTTTTQTTTTQTTTQNLQLTGDWWW